MKWIPLRKAQTWFGFIPVNETKWKHQTISNLNATWPAGVTFKFHGTQTWRDPKSVRGPCKDCEACARLNLQGMSGFGNKAIYSISLQLSEQLTGRSRRSSHGALRQWTCLRKRKKRYVLSVSILRKKSRRACISQIWKTSEAIYYKYTSILLYKIGPITSWRCFKSRLGIKEYG